MKPIFSVIIPAFNRLEPLRATLRSALAAAAPLAPAVEIIVVDDGSESPLATHFTPQALVRFIPQPNLGSIVARQTGLRAATGEYVLFLDSDDYIHPQKLLRHAAALAAEQADIAYDDMARAILQPDQTLAFAPATVLPRTTDCLEFLLRIQPAPHGPSYRRSYLDRALNPPLIPSQRAFDASGDVWLYYNLLLTPARLTKIDAALTATGVHEEDRYSRHWEKLGLASLLIAESFFLHCPGDAATQAARSKVGEIAFHSYRRLPRDYRPDYAARLLRLWAQSPRGPLTKLGGRKFVLLARLLGPARAARWLRRCNAPYASCRTLDDASLQQLFLSLDA